MTVTEGTERKSDGSAWTIEDYTGTNKGYLRIFRNGKRVADVFPFAAGEDPARVMTDAGDLVACANAIHNGQ